MIAGGAIMMIVLISFIMSCKMKGSKSDEDGGDLSEMKK